MAINETEARIQEQFLAAREKALKQVEEYISTKFADGQETVDFWFNAFSMWGASNPSNAFWKDFPVERSTDDWSRAIWSLNKADALAIARYVETWNADWEYAIARNYDVDQNDYYNAYNVSFSPASGREHTISVRTPNGHYNDSWQQS